MSTFTVGDRVISVDFRDAYGPGTVMENTPAGPLIAWDDIEGPPLVYSGSRNDLFFWLGADDVSRG